MYQVLLKLEKKFFKQSYITDKKWLDNVLDDDFQECGKSGLLFNKARTIHALLSWQAGRNIALYNFDCKQIRPDCWLVYYITKDGDDTLFYRTSIWVKQEQMKLCFHQASRLEQEVILTEC